MGCTHTTHTCPCVCVCVRTARSHKTRTSLGVLQVARAQKDLKTEHRKLLRLLLSILSTHIYETQTAAGSCSGDSSAGHADRACAGGERTTEETEREGGNGRGRGGWKKDRLVSELAANSSAGPAEGDENSGVLCDGGTGSLGGGWGGEGVGHACFLVDFLAMQVLPGRWPSCHAGSCDAAAASCDAAANCTQRRGCTRQLPPVADMRAISNTYTHAGPGASSGPQGQ